jgi:hypothetical protein
MDILDLLQAASRVFYGGLEPYNYGLHDTSSTGDKDGEVDDAANSNDAGETTTDRTGGRDDVSDDQETPDDRTVYSPAGSDPGAFRRNRAFAEFEARTFFHNVARRGRNHDPCETHRGPANELKTCLARQFGSDLSK